MFYLSYIDDFGLKTIGEATTTSIVKGYEFVCKLKYISLNYLHTLACNILFHI